MSIPNIHPETNIAYGFVVANDLDPEIVHSILQAQTLNISLHSYMQDNLSASDFEEWKNGISSDEVVEIEDAYHENCTDEEIYESTYQNVKLRSSWLGGALHFFVLESPHITESAERASPCVPNAGILSKDMDGSIQSYTVPDDWWNEYE